MQEMAKTCISGSAKVIFGAQFNSRDFQLIQTVK
jgi:hypothetical protein